MPTKKPHTEKEAFRMVMCGWKFLLTNRIDSIVDVVKKSFYWPLTLYMLFGGAIFGYKYFIADTFKIEKAEPISEVRQPEFSLMPTAYAQQSTDIPIMWDGRKWGFADTNYIAKVGTLPGSNQLYIFVYNKLTRDVNKVFFSTDIRKQMK